MKSKTVTTKLSKAYLHSTSRSSLTLESSSRLLFPSNRKNPGCTKSLPGSFSSSLLLSTSSRYCNQAISPSSNSIRSLQINKWKGRTKKLGEFTNTLKQQKLHKLQGLKIHVSQTTESYIRNSPFAVKTKKLPVLSAPDSVSSNTHNSMAELLVDHSKLAIW